MEIVFKKVPFEEYLTFFETGNDSNMEHWIAVQHDYLLPPSWVAFNTYEVYCPDNISLTDDHEFVIPTGFKCVSDFKQVICMPHFDTKNDISFSKEELQKHIVIKGITKGNRCFQSGDKLIKLKFKA